MNQTRRTRDDDMNVIGSDGLATLVKTWSTGGHMDTNYGNFSMPEGSQTALQRIRQRFMEMATAREEKNVLKMKEKALKEAAK
eukprot:scaffold6900_cov113-Chaetoceros_neogracile.AAC.1